MRKYISFKIIIIVVCALLSSGSVAYALGYLKYENNTFLIHPGLSTLDVNTLRSSQGSNFSLQVLKNIHIGSDFKIESDGVATFEFKNQDNQMIMSNRGNVNPRIMFTPAQATASKWWMGLRDNNSKGNFYIYDESIDKTVFEIGGATAYFPTWPVEIKGVLDIKNANGFANVTVTRPDLTTMNRSYGLQIGSGVVLPSEIQLGEYVGSESDHHLFSMKKNGNIVEFSNNNPSRVAGAQLDNFFVDGELELDTDICTATNVCLVNQFARKLDCKVKTTTSSNTINYFLAHPSCDSGYEPVSVGCYINSQNNGLRYIRSTQKSNSCEFWKEAPTTSLLLEAYSVCCKL